MRNIQDLTEAVRFLLGVEMRRTASTSDHAKAFGLIEKLSGQEETTPAAVPAAEGE